LSKSRASEAASSKQATATASKTGKTKASKATAKATQPQNAAAKATLKAAHSESRLGGGGSATLVCDEARQRLRAMGLKADVTGAYLNSECKSRRRLRVVAALHTHQAMQRPRDKRLPSCRNRR
jgi:hypothetical protein